MNIFLLGVSNVGKSTAGELLAQSLGIDFYDLDDEVKKNLGITLEEFVSIGTLYSRDMVRSKILWSLAMLESDKVIAVTPMSYTQFVEPLLTAGNAVSIELIDSAENIFDRLVFSDENDRIYKDDAYKNARKGHYLSEIRKDLEWYGSVYKNISEPFLWRAEPLKMW